MLVRALVVVVMVVMGMVLVGVMGMIMFVISMRMMTVAVSMSMSMTMMSVIKGHHANQVDAKAKDADGQQFADAFHLRAIDKALNGLGDDLDADEPAENSN